MKRKVQVSVELSMLDWYKQQAELYGVSVSGLVNIAMSEYRMQKETIDKMPQFVDLLNFASKNDSLKKKLREE